MTKRLRKWRAFHGQIGLLVMLTAGSALAHGDWDQIGGSASHRGVAVQIGLPADPPVNTNSTAIDGFGGTERTHSSAIGPGRDIWAIDGEYLYRYDFTVGGSFSPLWSTQLFQMSDTSRPETTSTIAVDDQGNSYVLHGRDFTMTFESFDANGNLRTRGDAMWQLNCGEGMGIALAEPLLNGVPQTRVVWGFQGTETVSEIGRAYVWDTSGAVLAQYPAADVPNPTEKFGCSGHPAVGPDEFGDAERVAYYPGYYKTTDAEGEPTYEDYRIVSTDTLNPGTFQLIYSTSATNRLSAIAVDSAAGATEGNLFVWQSSASGWSLLRINPFTGAVVWSAPAEPSATQHPAQEVEPPTVGSTYVYARKPGEPGTIRRIDKVTGAVTDMGTTFGAVGPLSIGWDGGEEFLVFKDTMDGTLQLRKASDLTLRWQYSLGSAARTAVPIGLVPASGGALKPVVYTWGQVDGGGCFGFPQTCLRAFHSP